jgi:YidC/Oxa1 family membrane protein insertase
MDRTSWTAVILCISMLFGWGWWSSQEATKQAAARAAYAAAHPELIEPANPAATNNPTGNPADSAGADAPLLPDPTVPAAAPAVTTILSNELIQLTLSNRGASIDHAEMKDFRRHLGSEDLVTINETAKHGIGTLSTGPGAFDTSTWQVQSSTKDFVTYTGQSPEGLALTKTYRITDPTGGAEPLDPHEILCELTLQNPGAAPVNLGPRFLYAGSAAPLHLGEWSIQIGMFYLDLDNGFTYKTVDHYGGPKVLGIFGGGSKPSDQFAADELGWGGVNDQFFTTIIQPTEPYPATLWGSRFPVAVEGDAAASEKKRMFAAEAAVGLPQLTLNPGEQRTLRYRIYMGPKEYSRLHGLGEKQQRVMHYDEIPIFGWLFGWAIKPLASVLIRSMVYLKGHVGDYGLAIILVTLAIRLVIWPVYAKSARSMKRMAKLTPKMQELKLKYADDPPKMNQEIMGLYKTYGVNPLGGCLPMFIQLPVFLAFYRMLWSAVELRHESFLWVTDLSMPDTVWEIPGLNVPLNVLPILMGLTSFIQIAITPKTGDKTQQMIFMLMPIVFLFVCYNFAAALSLYWTVSNSFTILQTWIMNKMPEPELVKVAGGSGKPSFMERMQAQAEDAKKAKAEGGAGGGAFGKSRTQMPGEKGARHTKGKKKK